MQKIKVYLVRAIVLTLVGVILWQAYLLHSRSKQIHSEERIILHLKKDAEEKDTKLENYRRTIVGLSRKNWFYLETTNETAWVSTEPTSSTGENKGEKLSFPLPEGYRAWLNTPIPSERTATEKIPPSYPGDGLAGSRVQFSISMGTSNLHKSTFGGLLVVEFITPPRSNLYMSQLSQR